MVGFGILGTFVGLVLGLIPFSNIDFQNTEKIKDAIQELLSGVSTAFMTSVWGMVTSLLFNGIEKLTIGGINSEIANLQRSLDSLFTLTVQEEIAFQQADELEQQTAALKSFSTDLANDIKSAMAEGRQEILHELRNTVEAFSNSVVTQLTPILESLVQAIEELREQKEESSTDAIGKLIEEFQSSLSTSTVTQMEELAKTVGEASQGLKDLPDQIGVMIASVQEQIDQTRQLLTDSSREQIDQMKNMAGEMIKTLQGTVESAANQTSEQLDQQVENMKTVSAESIQTLQKTVAELKQSIASISDQQQDAVGIIISKTAQATIDAMDRVAQLIDGIATGFGQTVIGAADSINMLLQQQNEQTEVFNAQITNSKDILEGGQKMLVEMGASVTSVRQIIEEAQSFSGQLTLGANQLEEAGQQLMQAGSTFNQENEKYLTANRETIQQLENLHERTRGLIDDSTQQLENLHEQTLQLVDDSAQRFSTIDGGLQSIFSQIENGLSNYAITSRETINSYLIDFSTQLTDASVALAQSVEALNEVVQEAIDANERIGAARR